MSLLSRSAHTSLLAFGHVRDMELKVGEHERLLTNMSFLRSDFK